jgi:enediyne biosynthesis protein E4
MTPRSMRSHSSQDPHSTLSQTSAQPCRFSSTPGKACDNGFDEGSNKVCDEVCEQSHHGNRTLRPLQSTPFAILLLFILIGCTPSTEDLNRASSSSIHEPWFEEVSAAAGVQFRYETGFSGRHLMPEIKGGGVGLLDYDGDGLLDIFCVQAGSLHPGQTNPPGHRLFRNLGNWRFEDVTETAGVAGDGRYGMGVACVDFDGDGLVDIHITHVQGSLLYRNNGDGTFTDVTHAAGLTNASWGVGSAFFDMNNNGHLDLVIANYLRWSIQTETDCFSLGSLPDYCSPLSYNAPATDTLYRNRGDGTFEDITLASGLGHAYGNGLGVACADFNRDGLTDIYIANDAAPNQLWINQGDNTFVDEAMLRGCAVNLLGMSEAGMGVSSADLTHNGWRDLYVTHMVGEANRLFLNEEGLFTDVTPPHGPTLMSWPYTSFGLGFFDFDNDGELDLYVANGRVRLAADNPDPNDPYAEPNNLLRGLGQLQFQSIANAGTATALFAASRGAAFGDLNNNGSIDIVVVNRDGPIHILRNLVGQRGNWINLRILDQRGRDAIGAEVRIEAAGRTWWRAVAPHESYGSSNDPRIHCGLGDANQIDAALVRWPDGHEQIFTSLQANQFNVIRR